MKSREVQDQIQKRIRECALEVQAQAAELVGWMEIDRATTRHSLQLADQIRDDADALVRKVVPQKLVEAQPPRFTPTEVIQIDPDLDLGGGTWSWREKVGDV